MRKKLPLMSRNWSHTKALVLLEAGNKQCLSQNTNRQNDSEIMKNETKQGHLTMLSKHRWNKVTVPPQKTKHCSLAADVSACRRPAREQLTSLCPALPVDWPLLSDSRQAAVDPPFLVASFILSWALAETLRKHPRRALGRAHCFTAPDPEPSWLQHGRCIRGRRWPGNTGRPRKPSLPGARLGRADFAQINGRTSVMKFIYGAPILCLYCQAFNVF